MTDIVNTPRDGDRFRKALDRLEINGGRTPAGAFLAFSITEPLFCYERDTQEELVEVIADTLKSYAETFYEVENVTVQITSETRAVPNVPVDRIEPTLRLLPSFGDLWDTRELAGA